MPAFDTTVTGYLCSHTSRTDDFELRVGFVCHRESYPWEDIGEVSLVGRCVAQGIDVYLWVRLRDRSKRRCEMTIPLRVRSLWQ